MCRSSSLFVMELYLAPRKWLRNGKANLGHKNGTRDVRVQLVLEIAQWGLCKIRSQKLKKCRTLTLIFEYTEYQPGSNKISVRNGLAKDGMKFGEESSRTVQEMGNVELIEWKQTSETTQCPFAWNTYLRVWPWASCCDPIKLPWTDSKQHSKHWKPRLVVLHQ